MPGYVFKQRKLSEHLRRVGFKSIDFFHVPVSKNSNLLATPTLMLIFFKCGRPKLSFICDVELKCCSFFFKNVDTELKRSICFINGSSFERCHYETCFRSSSGTRKMFILENVHLTDYSLTQIQPIINKSKKYSLLALLRNFSRKIFKNSWCQNFSRLKKILSRRFRS